MCQSPILLSNGQETACRKCKLCKFNRVKDWAGRNAAQSLVSTASFAGDLTYGPELGADRMPIPGRSDHIRAAVLTYSDVQKFLKYLRWLGYEFDYFITGEQGSLKGRCHWHFILHFHGKVPEVILKTNFSDRHKNEHGELFQHEVCKAWPHGFMYWKKAVYEDCFYACKYILKDEDDEDSQRKPGLSKKPPIGTKYFEQVAEQAVMQGIAPQALTYRLPGIKKKDGEPVEFYLQGRTAELYLDHFIKTWADQRPNQTRPNSDLVDLYEKYGQVVFDEAALLIRREFPKGESRQSMPSPAEWQRHKVAVAEAKIERDELERSHWLERWADEGQNEQERQGRQEYAERERQRVSRERTERKHQQGFIWQFGEGWFKPRQDEQCQCHLCQVGHILPGSPEPDSASPSGGRGRVEPELLGKIGRWNRDYRDPAGSGPGKGQDGEGYSS